MAEYRSTEFRVGRHWTLERRLLHYSRSGPNGCRLWIARTKPQGHGTLQWKNRCTYAHRLAWICANGPIPDGLCVCHKCDVPNCINPDHLFLGTRADNNRDRHAKGRYDSMAHGENNGNAKLTAAQAMEIFHARGLQREIAAAYGIAQPSVGLIKRKIIWRHIHLEAA